MCTRMYVYGWKGGEGCMYTDGREGRDVCIRMEERGGMYVFGWKGREGCMYTDGREGRDVCILIEGRGGMYIY